MKRRTMTRMLLIPAGVALVLLWRWPEPVAGTGSPPLGAAAVAARAVKADSNASDTPDGRPIQARGKTDPHTSALIAPSESKSPTPSTAAQAEARQRLLDFTACHAAQTGDELERARTWAQTLPEVALANAAGAFDQALGWAVQRCQPQIRAALAAAEAEYPNLPALAGLTLSDPLRRLWEATRDQDPKRVQVPQMRQLLDESLSAALVAPNVVDFQLLMTVAERMSRSGADLGAYVLGAEGGASVWRLAACDLGADCGPQSPAMYLACLHELLCGYPSFEQAMIDAYWPQGSIEQFQAGREQLVARLRAGGQGVFDPIRPGSG